MIHIFSPRGDSERRRHPYLRAPKPEGTIAEQAEAWDRRRFLTGLGLGALYFTTPGLYAQQLVTTPAQTEGPYYPPNLPLDTDNDLVILGDRLNPAAGTISYISGRVLTASGSPVANAVVEIWQADNNGAYIHPNSPILPRDANFQGFGEFLTDSRGRYLFRTVVPGLYPGRTRHVHVKVKTRGGQSLTTQLYIQGVAQNASDGILNGIPASQRSNVLIPWNSIPNSPIGALWAQWDIVLNYSPDTSAAAEPVLPQPAVFIGGAVDAAGYQPRICAGSWVSIFGIHLASVTRGWDPETEIVNGEFPTSIEGVSVTIGGKPAYPCFVSPGQVNVQVPSGLDPGQTEIVVRTPNGVSAPIHAEVAAYQPEFFCFFDAHIAAVRNDGEVVGPAGFIDGVESSPAVPGEIVLLFGGGFGETNPSIEPGRIYQGAAPLTENTVIRIGGVEAQVEFAGISAAGLYQFNVVVPNLPAGSHKVVAEIAGVSTLSEANLEVGAAAAARTSPAVQPSLWAGPQSLLLRARKDRRMLASTVS